MHLLQAPFATREQALYKCEPRLVVARWRETIKPTGLREELSYVCGGGAPLGLQRPQKQHGQPEGLTAGLQLAPALADQPEPSRAEPPPGILNEWPRGSRGH